MPQDPLDPRVVLGLEPERLPRHIAIIMDGNGRWAQARGMPRIQGHQEGAKSVREVVQTCSRLSIGYLTLYSFSLENWNRPKDEVNGLMQLYAEYLVKERDELMDTNTRLVQVGRRDDLPDSVLRELDETVELCQDNTGLTLCLALNYGSRYEMVTAARELARRAAEGQIRPDDIDEAMFSDALYTAGIPDPDLLLRTSGEHRLSNFLLWQVSYSEFVVMDVHWPDFRSEDLFAAIKEYARRDRRFGRVSQGSGASAPSDDVSDA